MSSSKAEGKRRLKETEDEEEEEDDEDQFGDLGFGDEIEKKKKGKKESSGGGSGSMPVVLCHAESCTTDMTNAKKYHRRHKVCEFHAKASLVVVNGLQQRFCQQCSRDIGNPYQNPTSMLMFNGRFHVLMEFDDSKRSCRRRLAGHNERRRKSSSEYQGDASN